MLNSIRGQKFPALNIPSEHRFQGSLNSSMLRTVGATFSKRSLKVGLFYGILVLRKSLLISKGSQKGLILFQKSKKPRKMRFFRGFCIFEIKYPGFEHPLR